MFKQIQSNIYLITCALRHCERPYETRKIHIDVFEYNEGAEIPHIIHRYMATLAHEIWQNKSYVNVSMK
jgi:hypothetical protein